MTAFAIPSPLSLTPLTILPTTSLKCTATPSHTPSTPIDLPSLPILSPTPGWASGTIASPVVKSYRSPTGTSYAMWYTARPTNWPNAALCPPSTLSAHVGLALSENPSAFVPVPGPLDGPVLSGNDEQWWAFDTVSVDVGDVVVGSSDKVRAEGGVYFLYYTGTDGQEGKFQTDDGRNLDVPGLRRSIGLAISKDGEHFTRLEGHYPSGALLEPGQPGEFDELFVASPNILRPANPRTAEHAYIMHYYTFDPTTRLFAVGRALSADGIRFRRDATSCILPASTAPFAARGASRCAVIERDSTFLMFVEVVGSDGVHRIATCESPDCKTWNALSLALSPGPAGAWDAAGVSHPYPLRLEDGSLRLYYVGRAASHDVDAGRGTCVGVAASAGDDWRSLRRVPGAQ